MSHSDGPASRSTERKWQRARRYITNDNALAESKNASAVRKHLGYSHIPARHASLVNASLRDDLTPCLNFHRPCFFPRIVTDEKGRQRRSYPRQLIDTPCEKLKTLPNAGACLKPGTTFDGLDAFRYPATSGSIEGLPSRTHVCGGRQAPDPERVRVSVLMSRGISMRKLAVAPMFAAALLLAACGTSSESGGPASAGMSTNPEGAPAPAASAVSGTVTLQDTATKVSPDAALELSLVNVSKQPGIVINRQDFNPPQFPQAFRIPFSPGAVNARDLYVLRAKMQNRDRTYSTRLQQPVLTRGQPATVDLVLVAEPTPAEKMLSDFEQAKRQTGAMKVKSGSSSKIGESRSWQVFNDVHGVEFIIEQVNRAEKGFTKTQYAYRNSLPWVVVQEEMPKPDAKPTTTNQVGWDDSGVVVLNQKISGDETGKLSDDAVKALRKEAEAMYKRFSRKH